MLLIVAAQLAESVQDRRFSADLFKIIELINAIQSEQVSLTEKNIQLMTENSGLNDTVSTLKADILKLQQQNSELKNPSANPRLAIADIATEILLYCSEVTDGASAEMVTHAFNISSAKSELELGKLKEAKLIDYGSILMDEDLKYTPTQNGLALLDEHGFL